jgi:threonine/homoserine/homoserine lactone efflux protein
MVMKVGATLLSQLRLSVDVLSILQKNKPQFANVASDPMAVPGINIIFGSLLLSFGALLAYRG